jgi:Replication-relaxation
MRRGVAIGVAVVSSSSSESYQYRRGIARNSQRNLSVLSLSNTRSGGYVTAARLEAVREALSDRDHAVISDVAALRLMTGAQLERLRFADLAESSRPVVRRRVLGRLVKARVLGTLTRRIGGVRAGSSGLVYALDVVGQRLASREGRPTRPGLPGERFTRHVLAVSQLYVDLVEHTRTEPDVQLEQFEAEPASWWPDGQGGRLKPDAYVLVAGADHSDHYWVEVDLATEHGPALKAKFLTYLDFYNRGQLGPKGVMPWVLVTVPDDKRCSDVVRIIRQLPTESRELFTVALHNDAANAIVRRLGQP